MKKNFEEFAIVDFLKQKIKYCLEQNYYCNIRDYSKILAELQIIFNIRDKIKYISLDLYNDFKKELDINIYLIDIFLKDINIKVYNK